MVYAAIDVHRKRSQLAVVDEQGNELSNHNYDNASEELRAALEELEPGTKVAFEASSWSMNGSLQSRRRSALTRSSPTREWSRLTSCRLWAGSDSNSWLQSGAEGDRPRRLSGRVVNAPKLRPGHPR